MGIKKLILVVLGILSVAANASDKDCTPYAALGGRRPDPAPAQRVTPPPPSAEKGKQEIVRLLDIFKNPERHLDPTRTDLETTPLEDLMLNNLALRILREKSNDTPNASHIADHVAAIESPEIAKALADLGIPEHRMIRLALTHDLGKEYEQLPADFKAFLEETFPKPATGPDTNFLPRVIMGHEFGSMLLTEKIAREAGIPEAKIPRLLAIYAHHNAGYDPKLPGNHFWVKDFAWGRFANTLRAKGIDIPAEYAAVNGTQDGGRVETIVLTAIDRAAALNLTSQEKYINALHSAGKFNNGHVVSKLEESIGGVLQEVDSVLSKLQPRDAAEKQKFDTLRTSIINRFAAEEKTLVELARELPLMARGEGKYGDRPVLSQAQLDRSVVYKTKAGEWIVVDIDQPDANRALFAKINADYNFTGNTLTDPRAVRTFRR